MVGARTGGTRRWDSLSERDLELKLAVARWFWALGSAPLLRVRVSTFKAAPARGKASLVELTDLDVLGVEIAPDFAARYRIAECKSGRVGALELFWLRGVLDFFGADDAYLVVAQERDRTSAMRTLAERLDLGLLVSSDFERLSEAHGASVSGEALFDADVLARFDHMLGGTPASMKDLSDYVGRLFWQLPMNRNLEYGISYLEQAKTANLADRGVLCLLGEHAFRYCLALFSACESVMKRGLPDLKESLPVHLYGGEHNLREAHKRVDALKALQRRLEGGERADLDEIFQALPPYYDALLELITRLLRRPQHATLMLRALRTVVISAFANKQSITDVIGEPDPITVKLVLDVVSFLVGAAGLDRGVVSAFESALQGDTGDPAPPDTSPTELRLPVDT